ncbi:MAG: hypothetical protein JWO66_1926, partial [Candidatus Eremiobacteraeota bacterium]|nr:hypothetical protein [Candidatus Eremiobacteraeota bacterium]
TCATDCEPSVAVRTPGRYRPVLQHGPLTFGQPLPACGCASTTIANDPRRALPCVALTGAAETPRGPVLTTWSPRADLLASGPDDASFVAEIDDDGRAHVRFGDGERGRRPEAATSFDARYRVGSGPQGNVGAETINYLVFRETTQGLGALVPRNPLPAAGGSSPESTADVRMFAPFAFRDVLERAITAGDYATLAADNARRLAERLRLVPRAPVPGLPVASAARLGDARAGLEEEPGETDAVDPCLIPFRRLQNAKASMRWTGSWYEARVAVDPLGAQTADHALTSEIAAYLEPYRRIGHDLGVSSARYVPLDLALSVCVAPNALRGHIESALWGLLGTGVLADGTLGAFNPDALTFGHGILISQIVAAVQAVHGVTEVQVVRLARYVFGSPPAEANANDVPAGGVLRLGAFEIPRLDNDPNALANGRLTLILRGGR